ncbi:YncE family protein [Mycobacterium sp. MYCO198283]|uniref:YncE family protein n=1 Tax=Mycobacterium sp. MYCO198283 TaxID=2883505 RepID=UPI001E523E17|nr:YncE family protein [Mycobacterium sp. MYCO198283]MCG5430909.1 YncE family protein [Mycobacterium sp. MYCO198283]
MAKMTQAMESNGTGGLALAEPTTAQQPPTPPVASVPVSQPVTPRIRRIYEQRPQAFGRRTPDPAEAPAFSLLAEVAVGHGPIGGIAVDSDSRVVVANSAYASVSVVDPATAAVDATLTGMVEPYALAADRGRAFVGAVSAAYDAVAVMDTVTGDLTTAHPVALSVRAIAVSPDGKRLFLGRSGAQGSDVAVMDAATGTLSAVSLPPAVLTVDHLALGPEGRLLYVAVSHPLGGDLVVIDTTTLQVVGGMRMDVLRGLSVSADGRTIFAATYDAVHGGSLMRIDAAGLAVRSVSVLAGPVTEVTMSRDGRRGYVVSDQVVAVVCTTTGERLATLEVSGTPSCVIESRDGNQLFVADYDGGLSIFAVASAAARTRADVVDADATASV